MSLGNGKASQDCSLELDSFGSLQDTLWTTMQHLRGKKVPRINEEVTRKLVRSGDLVDPLQRDDSFSSGSIVMGRHNISILSSKFKKVRISNIATRK